MKSLFGIILGLLSVAAFSQEKKLTLTQKFVYSIHEKSVERENDLPSYIHYIGKDTSVSLMSATASKALGRLSEEYNFLILQNWMLPIKISGISQDVHHDVTTVNELWPQKSELIKIERTGQVDGVDCQYYGFYLEDKDAYEMCFCIDEDNAVNNAAYLLQHKNINGLILSIEEKEGTGMVWTLEKVEKLDLSLAIDIEQVLTDIEAHQQSKDEAVEEDDTVTEITEDWQIDYNKIYDDPLYTYGIANLSNYEMYSFVYPVYGLMSNLLYKTEDYSYYGQNPKYTREQLLDFFSKNTQSLTENLYSSELITKSEKEELDAYFKERVQKAEDFEPEAIVDDEVEEATDNVVQEETVNTAETFYYYNKYASKYKDIDVANDASLAYDILTQSEFKKNAPMYCDDLANKIPNFENKELSLHVQNAVGQICDLYLYENGGSVDLIGTIDSMRKSMLEIEKLRKKISKKDKKLLVEFLKQLD